MLMLLKRQELKEAVGGLSKRQGHLSKSRLVCVCVCEDVCEVRISVSEQRTAESPARSLSLTLPSHLFLYLSLLQSLSLLDLNAYHMHAPSTRATKKETHFFRWCDGVFCSKN